MLYSTNYISPLGPVTLASDGKTLNGLWNDGQKYFASTMRGEVIEKPDLPVFTQAAKWLDRYFAGKNPAISGVPLTLAGGEFRLTVWKVLCEIPYGEYTTYSEIAKIVASRMNKKNMSSQAIGGAVGHNPISIIIPCHRVIGSNGSLTGYAGGISKKIQLLELEGVDTSAFFIPSKGTAL